MEIIQYMLEDNLAESKNDAQKGDVVDEESIF
mgnify:CR=1 FL=1